AMSLFRRPAEQKQVNEERARPSDGGFTLIEMLTVVVIIGVLAAIAIPLFMSQRQQAQTSTADVDLRTTAEAMESYLIEAGTYGTAAQVDVDDQPTLSNGSTVIVVQRNGGSGYCLAALRNSPLPGNAAELDATAVRWYDSQAGGLQPVGASGCPATV